MYTYFTVKTYCLDPHPDPESVFENLDPLDPDPHKNPVDPRHITVS